MSPNTFYKYERLSEEELLGDSKSGSDSPHSGPRSRYYGHSLWAWRFWIWAAQVLFFIVSCTLFLAGLNLRFGPHGECHDHDFAPQWSPVLDAVRNTGFFHRFDGSFRTPNAYKGPPTPLIDAAWDRALMAKGGVISIDESTLHAVNASAEYSVKLPASVGGGYMASVEVLHQLHCLNMLRQATYEDYYKDKAEPWEDSPEILRFHLDHCIDNLRQKLMCEADTGVLTYVWVKGHPAPFPDFNVQHKCRNFDNILEWVEKNQMYLPDGQKVMREPGARELETPP